MPTTLQKFPSEVRTFSFDFSQFAEIVSGDLISSVVSVTATPSDELTLGAASIAEDGKSIFLSISAGSAGTLYTLDALVQTVSGSRLLGQGLLFVLPE
ncbi:phage fiber-tail adaptor protein [Zavarzinella formosa]|uniref:phage fiber-tail adaptor protein n=1 Tax=Zavarzinella formosa TaxID=360055 RepID=UPI0002D687FA|nr:hypothetical protein [Zavarzinella formosa]